MIYQNIPYIQFNLLLFFNMLFSRFPNLSENIQNVLKMISSSSTQSVTKARLFFFPLSCYPSLLCSPEVPKPHCYVRNMYVIGSHSYNVREPLQNPPGLNSFYPTVEQQFKS